jgi:hypothetical protein
VAWAAPGRGLVEGDHAVSLYNPNGSATYHRQRISMKPTAARRRMGAWLRWWLVGIIVCVLCKEILHRRKLSEQSMMQSPHHPNRTRAEDGNKADGNKDYTATSTESTLQQ